jgi:hypothetical protein
MLSTVEKEKILSEILTKVYNKSDKDTRNFMMSYRQGRVSFETKVAGTTFTENGQSLLHYIANTVGVASVLIDLVREPDNEFDKNAIKVILYVDWSTKRYHVGYIPKKLAELLAPLMDNGMNVKVERVRITGGQELGNYGLVLIYELV